jgi:copper homeostasis protein
LAKRYLLEISVETVEGALAAQRGGADRIELCADLSIDGITPGPELMSDARSQVRIPIFSMVRPRGGDFVHTDAEFESMKRDIAAAKKGGMDGVVFGILTRSNHIDVERTQQLVELAAPLPVTFHRAFDECRDLSQALEDVIRAGCKRILTSGGASTAAEGGTKLGALVKQAGEGIVILPGAGTNAENIRRLVLDTGAKEFHAGLSTRVPRPHADFELFEGEVRKLATALDEMGKIQQVNR